MMAELANCEYCDKVFAKINRSICPDCMKEEEKKYERVVQFLRIRKNRQATITEISEATEVEHEIILQFVKDKRLRRSQFLICILLVNDVVSPCHLGYYVINVRMT